MSREKENQSNSKILSLQPQTDKNELSCTGGQSEYAECFDCDVKYIIILPRGDWITKLIVQQNHETWCHIAEINRILAQLSQRYWKVRDGMHMDMNISITIVDDGRPK